MKGLLVTIAFFGFIALWLGGRIHSGWALLAFGILFGWWVACMTWSSSGGPRQDGWRRRR